MISQGVLGRQIERKCTRPSVWEILSGFFLFESEQFDAGESERKEGAGGEARAGVDLIAEAEAPD